MGMRFLTALVACLAVLASCAPNVPAEMKPDFDRVMARGESLTDAEKAEITALAQPENLKRFLGNTTSRSFSYQHGTQVEYLGADGRAFLWYPGNDKLVPGTWTASLSGRRPQICFGYDIRAKIRDDYMSETSRKNLAAKGPLISRECQPARVYLLTREEIVDGDPLRLGSGKMPFELSKENAPLSELARRAGRSQRMTNKITW